MDRQSNVISKSLSANPCWKISAGECKEHFLKIRYFDDTTWTQLQFGSKVLQHLSSAFWKPYFWLQDRFLCSFLLVYIIHKWRNFWYSKFAYCLQPFISMLIAFCTQLRKVLDFLVIPEYLDENAFVFDNFLFL